MKALKTSVFLTAMVCAGITSQAQTDSAIVIRRATELADSIQQAFQNAHWNEYINMSYPGVVRYYGGKQDFQEYAERLHNGLPKESRENIQLVQLLNQSGEWQCVIRKERGTLIDGKKASVISYMIGQSTDEGQNWKYFDVAYNTNDNLVYIMPDIFAALRIPQRQIVFENDQIVSHQ